MRDGFLGCLIVAAGMAISKTPAYPPVSTSIMPLYATLGGRSLQSAHDKTPAGLESLVRDAAQAVVREPEVGQRPRRESLENPPMQPNLVYDSPPWRSAYQSQSLDSTHLAVVAQACETYMSGPTYGDLLIDGEFLIPDSSPVFAWSPDSRWLLTVQWVKRYRLFMRQRLLLWDALHKQLFATAPAYRLLIIDRFDAEDLFFTDSAFWKPKAYRLSRAEFSGQLKPLDISELRRALPVYRYRASAR